MRSARGCDRDGARRLLGWIWGWSRVTGPDHDPGVCHLISSDHHDGHDSSCAARHHNDNGDYDFGSCHDYI